MERGTIICLKKSGEYGYRIEVSDGDICNFGPGVECHVRFGIRQGKGVFCSVSSDKEGLVQLKKISECSIFVNGAQVEDEKYLNYGDIFEIEGRKFIWENISYEESSISDVEEKKSPVKRISSTTQIHGRKSINEFRASKKFYKSTNTSSFWTESEEDVLTNNKNKNAGFSVSTSPIRLTYLQNSPQKQPENYSFKVKLKNSTPKRTSVRTPKLKTPISENKCESARKTPKSAIITPKSVKTPESAIITPNSVRKTPKSVVKTPKSAVKTPKSAIITPKPTIRTPKSAIKTPKSAFKNEKLLIKTPRSTAKTPNSSIQTRKSALRTPKSTVKTSKVLVKTPRLLRSEIKSSSSSKLLKLNNLQRKQSETTKYFENNTSMQLPTKIPRKYFFTPPTRTPRSNVRNVGGKAASFSLINAQNIKTPILAERQSPVQSNRSPKGVISIKTPKSVKKLVSSTLRSIGKVSKQNNTPASSLKSPKEILKTPRSTRKRTLEATEDLKSEARESKLTDNINRSIQSSVLSAKSPAQFLTAVSPTSNRASRKSPRVSFSVAKSSVRKFAGTKRKRSGSDSFQRSLKRQHLECYTGSDSEKENTGSASSLSIINSSSMNLSETEDYKETDKLFNSFVNLEKNDFINQDIPLASKALTGPKQSVRNTRRLSAPGRFVRLLNMDSNTSTPKKLTSDTELLQKVFGENTPIVSINVNYNTNITYTENSEHPSTSKACGNLSGIKRLTRNSDLISFDSPRISISKLSTLQNKSSEQNSISILHDSREESPMVQLNISSKRSLVGNMSSPKQLLQIEASPLNKSKSKSDVEQRTLRNSSLKVKNRSGIKQVLHLAKSPKNDLTNIKGVKKLFATPKLRHSPRNDFSDVKGVRQLMKTPGHVPKSPKNDLTNVQGVRALMRTPKSPKNDLRNVVEVKKIMSKSPRNDLSDVKGLKKLLKTPQHAKKSPKNDLTDVKGVKQLLRTPKPNPKSPANDLTEIKGVKNLMRTPKSPRNDLRDVYGVKRIMAKSPQNDLTDVRGVRNLFRSIKLKRSPRFTVSGVKKLLKSPAKKPKSPKNDLTDVIGVKNILRSPKSPPDILQNVSGIKRLVSREPSNRLSDFRGVKNILRTPKARHSPRNDLSDIQGLSKLMRTPKPKETEPKNDLRDVQGVKRLFNHSEPRNSLTDMNGVEDLFTETNSPHKSVPRKQKQSSTNSPAKHENKINPVLNQSTSYNVNNMDVLFDKLRDENESSIDDAIEKLILSTPKHTYERKGKSFTPTKIEASKNIRSSLGVPREHSADVQKWVEEQKLYLKAHSEQDEKVQKENTKVTRKRKAVEEVATTRTRTRREKQTNTNETEKSVTPRKRTRRQGNDGEDPVITTSTRSQRTKKTELTEDENTTPQTSKLTNKRTRKNNTESTPVTEVTGKSTRQRVKKPEPESKPPTPAPEILEKGRSNRRGIQHELNEANEEKEKPSQSRGKRKLGALNDFENSEEQVESTNKKSKSKSTKESTKHEDKTIEHDEQTKKVVTRTRSKRINSEIEIEETTELPEKLNGTDIEEEKAVLKKVTRSKAKNAGRDEQPEIITKTRSQAKNPKTKTNSEDSKHIEDPTTKKTRSKNKTEKGNQKENKEPEKYSKKTTRRQAKENESINKNEQEEEIKISNPRTRKRGAITEEQATKEPQEKGTRSKKRSASKKNEKEKEDETKSTEHKISTKKSNQEPKQEEVTEPRRSARTRKAKM